MRIMMHGRGFGMLGMLLAMVATAALTGCLSLELEVEAENGELEMEGLANGFAGLDGIRPWDGTLMELNTFGECDSDGEIISLGVWPLTEVGVGLVGARVQILPVELGVGTLFYEPESVNKGHRERDDGDDDDDDDDDQDDDD